MQSSNWICATLSEWQRKLGNLKDLSDKEQHRKMCPEEHLPVSKNVCTSHHSGFLTPSVRSQCVSMGTSTLIFCVILPSVLLSPVQPVRRQWASGGTVWIYKLACTPLQGNTLVWDHCLCLYTSGGPTLAFVTQWLSLMMLFGSEEPQSLIQIENNVVYLSLDPNIIFDVTMVSSAEIPWYFRPSRETQEAAGFLFIFS